MADLHLSIPGIEGTSEDAQLTGQIVLDSWSWDVDRITAVGRNPSRTKSTIDGTELIVEKALDRASPKLLESALLGKVHAEVRLTARNPSADGQLNVFLTLDLTNVMIQSVQQIGDLDEHRERVVLDFGKITYTYNLPGSAGEIDFTHSF